VFGNRCRKAIKIVDFWHVCEHVGECAKAFYGQRTESGRQWSMKVCGHLRAGDVNGALKEVEALNPRGSKPRREQKHSLVTYLTNSRDWMDYPRYEALGLPIGSGEVEAQCKSLVQSRCKQAGMRWHSESMEQLLRVRCALKDGRYWRHFGKWPDNSSAWQARRRRLGRRAAGMSAGRFEAVIFVQPGSLATVRQWSLEHRSTDSYMVKNLSQNQREFFHLNCVPRHRDPTWGTGPSAAHSNRKTSKDETPL
jgi:hypothetical protein